MPAVLGTAAAGWACGWDPWGTILALAAWRFWELLLPTPSPGLLYSRERHCGWISGSLQAVCPGLAIGKMGKRQERLFSLLAGNDMSLFWGHKEETELIL